MNILLIISFFTWFLFFNFVQKAFVWMCQKNIAVPCGPDKILITPKNKCFVLCPQINSSKYQMVEHVLLVVVWKAYHNILWTSSSIATHSTGIIFSLPVGNDRPSFILNIHTLIHVWRSIRWICFLLFFKSHNVKRIIIMLIVVNNLVVVVVAMVLMFLVFIK